jgi:hypothetical protein
MQIVALLSPEERRMIGIQDEDVEKWGDELTRKYVTLRSDEEQMREVHRHAQAGYLQSFFDEHGKETTYSHYLLIVSKARFSIDWNVCRILRQIYEICESKGVRIGRDVEAAGPRGHVVGVSKIVGERVEAETQKVVDESAESEGVEEESEKQTEQQ